MHGPAFEEENPNDRAYWREGPILSKHLEGEQTLNQPSGPFVEDELLRRYRRDKSDFLIGQEGAEEALSYGLFGDKEWY